MIIHRQDYNLISNKLKPGKVVILWIVRRVGKAFLIKEFIKTIDEKYLLLNGEDFAVHELLNRRSIQNYRNIIGNSK